MVRTPTYRLLTALAAVVFATTGGMTGMQAHPLSMHGPHADEVMAAETGHAAHHASSTGAADHHSEHSEHGNGIECTCLGPCQGGGTPSLPDPSATGTVGDALTESTLVPVAVFAVREHPAPYLRPLPNGPPERV